MVSYITAWCTTNINRADFVRQARASGLSCLLQKLRIRLHSVIATSSEALKITFAAKHHTMVMVAMVMTDVIADAGIILSVIIHTYQIKSTPNEPSDDNDSAESSA